VGATVQYHVAEKRILVNLTSLGTRNSDTDGDLVFNKIGQVVIGAIAGRGFFRKVSVCICPYDTIIDKKNIHRVTFFGGDLGKLEAAGCTFIAILSQRKQKISHFSMISFVEV